MRTHYIPVPGAHIRKAEAQIIGDAREACEQKLKHDVSARDFLQFCKDANQPVNAIWKAKKQEFVTGAGLAAADYLLRSIRLDTRGLAHAGPPRAIVILHQPKDADGKAYTSEDVRKAPDLLLMAEDEFRRDFYADAKKFADLAGVKKMKTVAAAVLAEFK